MNKLKTTDVGGMPFDSDDLRYLDEAQRAVFASIGTAMMNGSSNAIISLVGCDVVSNGLNWDVSAGYLFANGEFFAVPVHSVLKGVDPIVNYWGEHFTFDPAGNENFKITGSFDTYQIREFKLKNSNTDGAAGAGDHLITSLKSFSDVFTTAERFEAFEAATILNQNNEPRFGVVADLYDGSVINYSVYTTFTELLSTGNNVAGSYLLLLAGSVNEITITSELALGTDWIRIGSVNSSGSSDIIVIGGGLDFDGSGNIDWNSNDPKTFLIINNSDVNQGCPLLTLKKTKIGVSMVSKFI